MSTCTGTYHRLSSWLRNHTVAASLIVLICSASVRLFMAERVEPHAIEDLYPDANTYLQPARSVIEHGAFLDSHGNPMVDRTPGYPTLLMLLMLLVGDSGDLHAILVAQAAILSIGVLILYLFARRMLPPIMAFIGAILGALSPWGAVLAGVAMSDGPFVFVLALIFLGMKLADETKALRPALFMGASVGFLTGIAVLIRPISPLVIFVPLALAFSYGFKRRGSVTLLAVAIVCAVIPVEFWVHRNRTEAHFASLSDIPGKTAWRYLAARVNAEVTGQNRHLASMAAYQEDGKWALSAQEADQEHWKRANAVFRQHPFLTVYNFMRSAIEHAIHPSPDVLLPAKLSFRGDFFILAAIWAAMLALATLGSLCSSDPAWDDGEINRKWLLTLLAICSLLTLLSGISFAAGSRLRAPLELVIPLLSAIGLVRGIRAINLRHSIEPAANHSFVRVIEAATLGPTRYSKRICS